MSDIKGLPKSSVPMHFSVLKPWSVFLWALTLLAVLVLYASNLYFGPVNQDEGWYLYAARLVGQGKLPYIDYAFTQGPVMPLCYSIGNPLVENFGLAGGRLFTAFLGVLCLFSGAWLAYRLAAPRRKSVVRNRQACAALLAVILVGVNVYNVYFTTIVKTYSLTALFLLLGFLAFTYIEGRKGVFSAFFAGVMFALAAGTRSSVVVVIPILAAMLMWCLLYTRRVFKTEYEVKAKGRERIAPRHIITPMLPYARISVLVSFCLGAALALAAVFLPFLLKAPEAFKFGMFEYHTAREVGGFMPMMMLKAGSISNLIGAYFLPFSLFTIICLHVIFHQSTFQPARAPEHLFLLVVMALSAVAIWIVQFMPPFPYDDYQVNIFPLFAVALAVYMSWVMASEMLHISSAVLFLSLASVVASPRVKEWFFSGMDRIWVQKREHSQLAVMRVAGDNVRSLAGEKKLILTQDLYLAVEAGLDVPKGMEMGPFSYVPDWPREKAEACHFVNREMLLEIIKNSGAEVAAMSGYSLAIKVPSVTRLDESEMKLLEKALLENYDLSSRIDPFGQADTELRIFERKDVQN